jgi:hypothetical protein
LPKLAHILVVSICPVVAMESTTTGDRGDIALEVIRPEKKTARGVLDLSRASTKAQIVTTKMVNGSEVQAQQGRAHVVPHFLFIVFR